MRWRMTSSEFRNSTSEERASRLEKLVSRGVPVGVLAYVNSEPIGWCSVAPRETFAGLERSRVLPRVDDAPVWSVTCFFVDARFRGRGVSLGLLGAAANYARSCGATFLEAYPVDECAHSYRFMGRADLFARAGFVDVTPPGQARAVVRLKLEPLAQQPDQSEAWRHRCA
jgi:GNAT superfamily N-acetyltransferase